MRERGIFELYDEDPEKADAVVWGGTRRDFLKGAGLAGLGATLVGTRIPFARFIPPGWVPAAFAADDDRAVLAEKKDLRILNDRPFNAETPMHLLDEPVTPAARLFVRNNGLVPKIAHSKDAQDWTLTVDGEVHKPLKLSLQDLQEKFDTKTYQLVLECAGNGRAAYKPAARGNQWTYGAIGCPEWTGVPLKQILEEAGLKDSAVYTAYYGLDRHPSGDPEKEAISRGTPIEKTLDEHTLVAFAMNGKPLPALHGFPARLVCPGFPGSASGKWLRRIWIRDRIHDGRKMGGYSYRVPKAPVAPGADVSVKDMKIIEEMPVKSLITAPKSNTRIKRAKKPFSCRGFAWTGTGKVTAVHVSIDFGHSWIKADLEKPRNRFAWQRWSAKIQFPTHGYYEIWARATDSTGAMQPMVVPGWNPKGYLNNAMPRIAVRVT